MGLFFNNKQPTKGKFGVENYTDMHKFAKKYWAEFADMYDLSDDEGYEEACDYWREFHKK